MYLKANEHFNNIIIVSGKHKLNNYCVCRTADLEIVKLINNVICVNTKSKDNAGNAVLALSIIKII